LKKLLQIFAVIFSILAFQEGYSVADRVKPTMICPPDYPVKIGTPSPCWQMWCHMEPYSYQVFYYVDEEVPVCIPRCRWVTKTYEVEKNKAYDKLR